MNRKVGLDSGDDADSNEMLDSGLEVGGRRCARISSSLNPAATATAREEDVGDDLSKEKSVKFVEFDADFFEKVEKSELPDQDEYEFFRDIMNKEQEVSDSHRPDDGICDRSQETASGFAYLFNTTEDSKSGVTDQQPVRNSDESAALLSSDQSHGREATRKNFSDVQRDVLDEKFESMEPAPYLTPDEAAELAEEAHLTVKQVKTYFKNKRNRRPKRYKMIYFGSDR